MTSAMRSSPGGPLWWTLGTDDSRRRGRLTFPGTTVRKVSAALPKSEPPIIRLPRTTAASSNQRSDCPLPRPRSRIRKRARTTRFARAHRRFSRKSPGRGYSGDPHCSLRCAWSRPSILLHSPNTRVAHRMRLEFPVRRVGGLCATPTTSSPLPIPCADPGAAHRPARRPRAGSQDGISAASPPVASHSAAQRKQDFHSAVVTLAAPTTRIDSGTMAPTRRFDLHPQLPGSNRW